MIAAAKLKAIASQGPRCCDLRPAIWSGMASVENNQILPAAEVFGDESYSRQSQFSPTRSQWPTWECCKEQIRIRKKSKR